MTEYRLCTYTPIEDNEITLQANNYKEYISREPDVHGVKWVYRSINKRKGTETGQKRMKTENIWVAYYECHRAGGPRARKDQPVGGKTQKTRPVQKISKKNGCPATLVVSCPENDQDTVILRYSGEHNHIPGSIDDMRYLPISQNLRDVIEERLKSGFEQRSIRASIIKYFNDVIRSQYKDVVEGSRVIVHRDLLFSPVHSLIFDTTDKSWTSYFTKEEIEEITTYKSKKLDELPNVLNGYIEDLKKLRDIGTLKKKLSEEKTCSACEWVRYTVLDYLKLFKYGYLPLSDQTEGDVMRRIWFFIDTAFDTSSIHCRGGEKSSKSSSISRNIDRVLSAVEKIKRKMVGRKVDLLFLRQSLEYGCCECGRYDDPTKELHDGGFKMTKVLKDMLYCLYKSAPDVLRDVALPGFLLFETKFTVILCDAPAGHVCRIIRSKTMDLPEEPDEIYNQLFSILTLVYKSRLLMENARSLVRQMPVTIQFDQMKYNTLPPCYHSDFNKQKRRRNSSEED